MDEAFDKWFRKFNTWELSLDELLRCSYLHKDLEHPERVLNSFGNDDQLGDVVYINPDSDSMMTRHMAIYWWNAGRDFYTGWCAHDKYVASLKGNEA